MGFFQSFGDWLVHGDVGGSSDPQGYYDVTTRSWVDPYNQGSASTASDIVTSEPEAGSLEWLKNMAKDNPEYAEKLFDYLTNQQNAADARKYDEYVRKHEKSWLMEDLARAGVNPYLALNSLGGSSGSTIQASGNTYGASSAKNTKDIATKKLLALLLATIFGSGSKIASALIASS